MRGQAIVTDHIISKSRLILQEADEIVMQTFHGCRILNINENDLITEVVEAGQGNRKRILVLSKINELGYNDFFGLLRNLKGDLERKMCRSFERLPAVIPFNKFLFNALYFFGYIIRW